MGKIIRINVPDSFDNEWLVEQLRGLYDRLEGVVEKESDEEIFKQLEECLDIVEAMQKYAGY